MARIIPQDIKWVDVVFKVDNEKQLVLCYDCQEEMLVTSIICAQLVDNPALFTVNHNLVCAKCGGRGLISLKSR